MIGRHFLLMMTVSLRLLILNQQSCLTKGGAAGSVSGA